MINPEHTPVELTETDRALIDRLLPDVEFVYSPTAQAGISEGQHSRVYLLKTLDGTGPADAFVWKSMGRRAGLTFAEAKSLAHGLDPYRQALVQHGWRVPEVYATALARYPSDTDEYTFEMRIVTAEEYISGGDGEHLLQDADMPDRPKWDLIGAVASTLYSPFSHRNLGRVTLVGAEVSPLPGYGLDLEPANLAIKHVSSTKFLYGVDVFGPKLVSEEGLTPYVPKLESLPPKPLQAVSASREGALLSLWRKSEELWRSSSHSADTATERRSHFIELLQACKAPEAEVRFIEHEISQGYPWLNAIYSERPD